jgi:hypothetical protein
MKIIVYERSMFVGILTVKKPTKIEPIMLFENIQECDDRRINVLYFQDMDYGLIISDTIVYHYKKLLNDKNVGTDLDILHDAVYRALGCPAVLLNLNNKKEVKDNE